MSNLPDREELIEVDGDPKKIVEEKIEKVPNASVFIINKEDHTLGNMLRLHLLKDKQVLFAGYKRPHPLEHTIEIKVRAAPETSPKEVLQASLNSLQGELGNLKNKFESELGRLHQQSQHHTWD